MYQNLFDSHTHSENSPDGTHSVTFMMETALKNGLQGLAVTDHCDVNDIDLFRYDLRLQQSQLDEMKARAAFRQRMILTYGVEIGQPHWDIAAADRFVQQRPFDFILLSLHRLRGGDWPDFIDVDYTQMTVSDLHAMMRQYFKEMMEMLRWDHFDSLAHLNLPIRYLANMYGIRLDLHRYADEVDAVLQELAQRGKALEINTSGLRGDLRDTLPPEWVVKRFRELGGEYVTIGSDAHMAGDIGAGVQDAMDLLCRAGFEYFTFYRERKPVLLRIV